MNDASLGDEIGGAIYLFVYIVLTVESCFPTISMYLGRIKNSKNDS